MDERRGEEPKEGERTREGAKEREKESTFKRASLEILSKSI
jgi:hypothetical protein